MTNNDPIAEARRVLALSDDDDEQCYENELAEALRNLLAHAERLTAEYALCRSALIDECKKNIALAKENARLTAPATGDRADAAADIRHLMLYEDPRSEDHAILERAAALLEADARREVALAEAIRKIVALPTQIVMTGTEKSVFEKTITAVLAILAKVADGGER